MLLLKNATIINLLPPAVESKKDVLIDGGKIKSIDKNLTELNSVKKVIDLSGKFLLPGLVCSHNHFYSALARGIKVKIKQSTDFVSHLQNLWWRLDRALDEESLYYSGLIGALEAIKSGTTAIIDHNASPNFILGSLDILKSSFEKVGLRGILAYEITDRNGIKGMHEGLKESVRFIKQLDDKQNKNSIIEAAIGGHAPFTLSDKSLGAISELIASTNRGLHIHTAEDKYDSSYSHHLFGYDIIERLEKFKLVNDKSIFVHGLYLTNRDIGIINLNDAFLVHNPRSNMNNNVGYLNTIGQIKNLAIGTDGIGSNMFDEVRFGYFKNKDVGLKQSPNDFLKYLDNGNKILERCFGKKFGKIKVGYSADLVVYNYKSPTPIDSENLSGHFIFGFSSDFVESVIINGKLVYEQRQFPFEVNSIYEISHKVAKKLWKRMGRML